MRVVIQRVRQASVDIENAQTVAIGHGMLVLLGIEDIDSQEDADWICGKLSRLRIFPDEHDVMNNDIVKAAGSFLVVSQFTLHASTKKGNRPSYIKAARPEKAIPLYEYFLTKLQEDSGREVASGQFGAHMQVTLTNDGPVTIIIDSQDKE